MKNLFVPYDLSLSLKGKEFDEACIAYYDIEENNKLKPIPMGEEINSFHSNSNKLMVAAPTYQQVVDWFRNKHKTDITIMPVFREKCGYDSFKRDGYTFEIMTIEPCTYLTWADFNRCAEDRDEENKERDVEERCLRPSYKDYYECFNKVIELAIKQLK